MWQVVEEGCLLLTTWTQHTKEAIKTDMVWTTLDQVQAQLTEYRVSLTSSDNRYS